MSLPLLPSKLPVFTNEHLSVSRLKRYEDCPQAFDFQYIHKSDERAPRGAAPEFGTVLHDALERTYTWVVEEEFTGLLPEEIVTDCYRKAWAESGMTGLELYQEGLDIMRAYARDVGLVDHMNILAIEKEFNLLVGPGGMCRLVEASEKEYWRHVPGHFVINGYIDRVDRASGTRVEVVDYKSNRMLFTREEIDHDLQMSIYGLVCQKLYPWADEIGFAFHMIRHGVIQRTSRTQLQLSAVADYVIALGIRSEVGPYPARVNMNCGYCDHRVRCPEYAALLTSKVERVPVSDGQLETLAAERERVAKIAKAAYARKEELDGVLKNKLAANDGEPLILNKVVYRLLQYSDTSYAAQPIIELFQKSGLDPTPALSVDTKALNALLDLIEANDSVPKKVRDFLRVRVAAKAVKIPQKPRIDARPLKTTPR
jgi:hypothetical protein